MLAFLHFVVYVILLWIKPKTRPDGDGGLVEADASKRAMKMGTFLDGVKLKRMSHGNDISISRCRVSDIFKKIFI